MKIVSFVVLVTALLAALQTEAVSSLLRGDTEALRELSKDNMLLMLLFTLLLMTFQNLFTLIPLILIISVNVSMFGFTYGYIWSWVSSIIGAAFAFFVVRYWLQSVFVEKMNEQWKGKIEDNGFLFVFVGRIMPFMPTSVINIAAGVSSIRFKHFTYSTMIGNMIYFLVLAFIPLGIMSMEFENLIYLVIAGVSITAFIVFKFWQKRRMKRKKPGGEL